MLLCQKTGSIYKRPSFFLFFKKQRNTEVALLQLCNHPTVAHDSSSFQYMKAESILKGHTQEPNST